MLDDAIFDHLPALLCIKWAKPHSQPRLVGKRSFKHYNEENFKLDLSLVPWSIMEMFQSPDDQLMVFESLFLDVLNDHAQLRLFMSRRRLSHGSPSTFVTRWTSVTSSCDSLDHPGPLTPGTPTDVKGTLCVECNKSPSMPTFSTSFLLVSTPLYLECAYGSLSSSTHRVLVRVQL